MTYRGWFNVALVELRGQSGGVPAELGCALTRIDGDDYETDNFEHLLIEGNGKGPNERAVDCSQK